MLQTGGETYTFLDPNCWVWGSGDPDDFYLLKIQFSYQPDQQKKPESDPALPSGWLCHRVKHISSKQTILDTNGSHRDAPLMV